MTKTIDIDEAVELSMKEASMIAEIEAHEQHLKWAREIIQNRGKKHAGSRASEQVSKEQLEHAMKQAMMNWDE